MLKSADRCKTMKTKLMMKVGMLWLGFVSWGMVSCSSPQASALGEVALNMAERRGYLKAGDAADVRAVGAVLLMPRVVVKPAAVHTSSK